MAEQPRLIRIGRAMAVATLVSRLTGFARTLVLVAALGLGTRLLDAYTVANVTPNTIYELVFGGALGSVIVPLLVRTAADDSVDGDLFAQRLLSLVVYGLAVVVMITIVVTPRHHRPRPAPDHAAVRPRQRLTGRRTPDRIGPRRLRARSGPVRRLPDHAARLLRPR